ncbi:hypothetical protein AURDEDRAFT_163434 [Auricularia subglabra TFB-10046 SS5]|nr:hypothetical protein AURDEDRAFT_163434 [Auricularia subglabra TFB-10046 SS5]
MATIELPSLSGCALTVTHVTVDDRQVHLLIEACTSMPALATLCIVLVTWHALAPDARHTEDEVTLYQPYHVRNDCQCLGGTFSDWHDGGPLDGDVRPAWPGLESVELRATRSHSTVSADVLRGLADALTPARERPLTLVLSNGLGLSDDAQRPEIASLFAAIRRPDPEFCSSLVCVGRAAELVAAAARKKVEARKMMDKMLRRNGPHFHWAECLDAESDWGVGEEFEDGDSDFGAY